MGGRSSTYRTEILLALKNIGSSDMGNLLNSLSGELASRSGMPIFFYRYPFFSRVMKSKAFDVGDISLAMDGSMTIKHLEAIEYLYLRASAAGAMRSGRIAISIDLFSIHQKLGDFWLTLLSELRTTSFIIKQDDYDFIGFSFIDTIKCSDGKAEIILSSYASLLYMIDYLMPFEEIKAFESAKNNSHAGIVLRYLSSMVMPPKDMGIGFDTLMERTGMLSLSGIEQNDIYVHFKTHFKQYAENGFWIDSQAKKFKFDSDKYPQFIFPAVSYKEKEINKYIKQLSSDSTKSATPTPKPRSTAGYIDFSTIELTATLRDKADELGVERDEVEELFTLFKNAFSQSNKKYKNLTMTWKNFLLRERGVIKPKAENRGKAENLILNEDIREIALRYNLDEIDTHDIFYEFRNAKIANNETKENWLPLWENWLIRKKRFETKGKSNAYGVRTALENNFYLATLVSDEIKKMLRAKNISVSDVINGEVVVPDVLFGTYAVPPSMGKGERTLFSFRDQLKQAEVIARFGGADSVPNQKVPIAKPIKELGDGSGWKDVAAMVEQLQGKSIETKEDKS